MKNITLFITGLLVSILVLQPWSSAQQADADLQFTSATTEARVGDEFDVQVTLKNLGVQNVISVRSWLRYNNDLLQAVSVNTDESPFTLSAPGETEVSNSEGLVKLGRSNVSGGAAQPNIKVATVRFKVKTPFAATAFIEAYDYQVTELGHTSANIVDGGFPVNILSKKPDALAINLNPGAQPYSDQANADGNGGPDVIVVTNGFANLNRPQNLRVNTGPGYADLKWDLSDEPELVGYNVYYGKTSGMYTRRKTLGKVSQTRIDGLNNGEIYYFAVTSYDAQSRESDYSDEVAVIINEPLSSTSPFEHILDSLLAKIPASPQNGPLAGWLAFSAFGLGGTLAFRKKTSRRSSRLAGGIST